MISLCENCAYKMSDCKGNKDIEKVACQYFKKQKDIGCGDDCYTCPNRCRPWQNGYNYNESFRKRYEDMAEENSRLSHDNFELKKEIADWRAKAVQKWVDSREEKSCSRCIHYDKEEWELPCVRCSRGNKDYWKAGDAERG